MRVPLEWALEWALDHVERVLYSQRADGEKMSLGPVCVSFPGTNPIICSTFVLVHHREGEMNTVIGSLPFGKTSTERIFLFAYSTIPWTVARCYGSFCVTLCNRKKFGTRALTCRQSHIFGNGGRY